MSEPGPGDGPAAEVRGQADDALLAGPSSRGPRAGRERGPDPAADRPGSPHTAWFRPTPLKVFVLAFLALLASGVAVAAAQFRGNHLATWVSLGLSGGAALLTVTAVLLPADRPRR